MSTPHRARHRYTADPSAMYRVFGRVCNFTEAEQTQLNLPVRIALDGFLTGKAVETDFHTLAAAVNIAMICAERIGPVVEQACIAGRDAMARVWARHQACGAWGLDGPAIDELKQVVSIYEQLTSLLTGGQLKDAMTECVRRMQAGEVIQSEKRETA